MNLAYEIKIRGGCDVVISEDSDVIVYCMAAGATNAKVLYKMDRNGVGTEIDLRKFAVILSKVALKPFVVDTNLNILQDGLGHVFVEMLLTFSHGGINEKILINANDNLEFFESLAENTMLAIASVNHPQKIFMIQLPNP